MKKWLRRIRAAVVTGFTWAVAWAAVASVLAHAPGFNSDLPLAFLFAPLGFISGVVFFAILAVMERGRRFERMSLSRFWRWGAASGLLLSGIFVVGAALRGASVVGEFLTFGPILIVLSSGSAAGSLAIARHAERRELRPYGEPPAREKLPEEHEQELLGP